MVLVSWSWIGIHLLIMVSFRLRWLVWSGLVWFGVLAGRLTLLPINQSHVLCMISSCLSSPPHHPINHLTDIILPSRLKGTVSQDRSCIFGIHEYFLSRNIDPLLLGFRISEALWRDSQPYSFRSKGHTIGEVSLLGDFLMNNDDAHIY
jgi:hypothetical protein